MAPSIPTHPIHRLALAAFLQSPESDVHRHPVLLLVPTARDHRYRYINGGDLLARSLIDSV